MAIDCTRLLQPPIDAVPARVPLAVYTALARRVSRPNSRVVFIGDGSTDGLTCLSHAVGSRGNISAVPIGGDVGRECQHLRERGVRVDCNSTILVANGTLLNGSLPLADLYVWSQRAWRYAKWRDWLHPVREARCREHFGYCDPDYPASWRPFLGASKINVYDSFDVLNLLRQRQLEGALPSAAEVAIVLDAGSDHDEWTYRKLRDARWMEWEESFRGMPSMETELCHNYTRAVGRPTTSRHVCATRSEQERFWLMGGALQRVPQASVYSSSNTCARRADAIDFDAKDEAHRVRSGKGETPMSGLTGLLLPDGTTLCGEAADAALAARTANTTIDSSSPPSSAPFHRGGLVTIFAHRQVASEFAASAHVLGMSADRWLLRCSSLLIVCTSASTPTASLLRWLGWHQWPRSGNGLRLLVHTGNRLGAQGYSCGELYNLAALVRIWSRFPFVMALSGPDVLPLPSEMALLSELMESIDKERAHARAHARGSGGGDGTRGSIGGTSTAMLYDRFRKSKNDPLSYVEERFNMDLLVFIPDQWLLLPAAGGGAPAKGTRHRKAAGEHDASIWSYAATICVNKTRNRPEAVLAVVRKDYNLSVKLIGRGSRGSLIDIHKHTLQKPDAFVWHSHNMPNVVRWLQSAESPPNRYQTDFVGLVASATSIM